MANDPLLIQNQNKTSFESLPEAIRGWLNSEKTLDALLDIEERFHITGTKVEVLPVIITELVTGDLTTQGAIGDIQGSLGVSVQDATIIATTLKERILNPIAIPLKNISGIDIGGLPGVAATADMIPQEILDEQFSEDWLEPNASLPAIVPATSQRSEIPAATQPKPRGMETPGLRVMKDVKAPVLAEQKKPELRQASAPPKAAPRVIAMPKPFMLHEEKPMAPSGGVAPIAPAMKQDFSFSGGTAPVIKPAPRPMAAQFNSSFDDALTPQKPVVPQPSKIAPAEEPKVVHYTSFKTPLNPDGSSANNESKPE